MGKSHYCLKLIKLKQNIFKISHKNFGIGSFHSKYLIIGSGFSGMSLSRLLKQVINCK